MTLAVELAEKLGGEVTLFHVYSVPAYVVPDGLVLATPETLREVAARVDAAMARWKIEAGRPGPDADRDGRRARRDCRGREGVRRDRDGDARLQRPQVRRSLGSVAEKVVRRSPIPVVTVRAR